MLLIPLRSPNTDLKTLLSHEPIKELILSNSEIELSVKVRSQSLHSFCVLSLKVVKIHSCYDQWIVNGRYAGDILNQRLDKVQLA